MRTCFFWLFLLSPLLAVEPVRLEWGTLTPQDDSSGVYHAEITAWPEDGRLTMPARFPQIIAARSAEAESQSIQVAYNEDATAMHLLAPQDSKLSVKKIILETAEHSQAYSDGRILLSALEAKVQGQTAKLEQHPGNYRIGFWSQPADFVTWEHVFSRWGMYTVRLTYSNASPAGTEIEVAVGEAKVTGKLGNTQSWYRYTSLDVGTIYLAQGGKQQVSVKCLGMPKSAVMNLKSVSFIPACEGQPPVQLASGEIVLHGQDATVRGTNLRYETNPKKLTLGFWSRATDAATWQFTVNTPGEFEVEVLQGCGTGAGGSEVSVKLGEQDLRFIVEDTGHFQNFKPRVIGKVTLATTGKHELRVQPVKIAKNAALDLRQVRLIPVAK